MTINVNIDFNKILGYVKKQHGFSDFSQEEIDNIYEVGSYYGGCPQENYGPDDRENSVACMLSSFRGLYEASLKSNKNDDTNVEIFNGIKLYKDDDIQ